MKQSGVETIRPVTSSAYHCSQKIKNLLKAMMRHKKHNWTSNAAWSDVNTRPRGSDLLRRQKARWQSQAEEPDDPGTQALETESEALAIIMGQRKTKRNATCHGPELGADPSPFWEAKALTCRAIKDISGA